MPEPARASPISSAPSSPWGSWATACGAPACAPFRSAKPTSCAASKSPPSARCPSCVAAMVSGWLLYLPVVAMLLGVAHFQYAMPMPQNWLSLFWMVTPRRVLLPRHRPDARRHHQHHAGGHDRHPAPLHAHALPQRRHHPVRAPAQVGADRRRVHARLLPRHRLPGHLLPQPDARRQRDRRRCALLVTIVLGTFLAVQLFRWEKEEKIRGRNKLWMLAVLGALRPHGLLPRLHPRPPRPEPGLLPRPPALRHLPHPQHPHLRRRWQRHRKRLASSCATARSPRSTRAPAPIPTASTPKPSKAPAKPCSPA